MLRIGLSAITWMVLGGLGLAGPLRIAVEDLPDRPHGQFSMGPNTRPDGRQLAVDSYSLLLDGRPWPAVMGEFHYTRYPDKEWRGELLKMKAGGIDIVATYVFWIHHEEIEGRFDWSGCRDLRRFVQTVGDLGLHAVVRCGPWCHGEVRNGGFPDWLLTKGWRLRSDDPNYLAKVRVLYGQIARQLEGLLWKEGGPVIGIQLENEYRGPAWHLLTLKRIATEVGLDVPLYTRTGWPALTTQMPFGQILPLYGAYAEGFWDRQLAPMPGNYWAAFHFSRLRTDSNIANELLGRSDAQDPPDVAGYPYLTCEMGGGMMNSYHRRILIQPQDIESLALVKLGSGSMLLGYYMYHGGINPDGRITTLMESQSTSYTNYNDMPVKNYDFQAPLGQYGQVRPHYHLLRRLHLFVHDFGQRLARMHVYLPQERPMGRDDDRTLRWAVRSDGKAGFVFVNNYQRLRQMPAKQAVQFELVLPGGELVFPDRPLTVPADTCFVWPFNMDLGGGIRLLWSTSQPVCTADGPDGPVYLFAQTGQIPAQFAFSPDTELDVSSGQAQSDGRTAVVCHAGPGRPAVFVVRLGTDKVRIAVLSREDSLGIYKAAWAGRERVFVTRAGLVVDGDRLCLESHDPKSMSVGILPAPEAAVQGRTVIKATAEGLFGTFGLRAESWPDLPVRLIQTRQAGPRGQVRMGSCNVAAAPTDDEFAKAAQWRIELPEGLDLDCDPILRIHYTGDVARVLLDGRLLVDDFYNGNPLEIGLARYGRRILTGQLTIQILPLPQEAPIYLAPEARARVDAEAGSARIMDLELLYRYRLQIRAL